MQFPTEPVQNVGGTDHYLVPQSVGIRAVAYIIDSLVFALILLVFLYAFGVTQELLQATAVSWPQLAVIGGQCLYFFIFEAIFGRTPGKFIMQLRVVRADGGRVGVVGAFIRNLVRPLDLLFFGIVGAASILTGFKRQRIGDRLGRTQVVRELPLALVPPPYVPADKSSRRCPRCGALAEGDQSKCAVCGLDLDSAPPWPFGGVTRPSGGPTPGHPARPTAAPSSKRPTERRGAPPKAGGQRPSAARPQRPSAARPERPSRAASERPDTPPPYDGLRQAPAAAPAGTSHALDLHVDDSDTRLFAAREILMEGGEQDVRELARTVQEWEVDDRQFVIDVARTLDGWRPITVLEALRSDPDPELADGAREALATVNERTRREEEEQRAWEAARATHDDDLDEDEETADEDEETADEDEESTDERAEAGAEEESLLEQSEEDFAEDTDRDLDEDGEQDLDEDREEEPSLEEPPVQPSVADAEASSADEGAAAPQEEAGLAGPCSDDAPEEEVGDETDDDLFEDEIFDEEDWLDEESPEGPPDEDSDPDRRDGRPPRRGGSGSSKRRRGGS